MTRDLIRTAGLYAGVAVVLGTLHTTLASALSMPHSAHQFALRTAFMSAGYGVLLVLPRRARPVHDPADPQRWLTGAESERASQQSR